MLDVKYVKRYFKNNKWGLKYKVSESVITNPLYDDIRRIKGTDDFLKVRDKNKWGVIDCLGKSATPLIFDDILSYENNRFTVILNGRVSYEEADLLIPNPVKREPYSAPISIRLGYGRYKRRK